VNEVYDVMYRLDLATTDDEKARAVKEFWKIWYGDGRTYLTPNTFRYLHYVADYINSCVTKVTPNKKDALPCSFKPEMTISGFAVAARHDLSTAWRIDFTEVDATDPWVSPAS